MYSAEQLSKVIKSVEEKVCDANLQIEQISNEMEGKKSSMEMIKPTYERFTNWADEFDLCSLERKKMIVSQLVSRIEISKGYKINVELNMDYEQFCEGFEVVREDSMVLR